MAYSYTSKPYSLPMVPSARLMLYCSLKLCSELKRSFTMSGLSTSLRPSAGTCFSSIASFSAITSSRHIL